MERSDKNKPLLIAGDERASISFTDTPAQSSTMLYSPGQQTGTIQNVTSSFPMTNLQGSTFKYISHVPVGPRGVRMRCYHCGADIKTTATESNKDTAHLACIMLASLTCCLCFWIPYCCCKAFKRVDHRCPCCDEYLGTYNA